MSLNKQTVEAYLDGFRRSDHAAVLACLTDDVEWLIPGAFHVSGKAAFDGEIENEGFTGQPNITLHRLTEENDVVIAEGTVLATPKDGPALTLLFCDVFELQDAKIRRLTSYMVGGDAETAIEALV